MGRVYKAVQTRWNEVVAINVLAPSLQDDDNKARFYACIRKAYEKRRGDERNPILDICDFQGVVCVVLAYNEGTGAPLDVAAD
jgi:hypothetical protein